MLREPYVGTRTNELLDYAGWVHPLAAADVLAGETTERRRYVLRCTCTALHCSPQPATVALCLAYLLVCLRFGRFMHHLRSSGDLSDKQIKQLGRPRFSGLAAA